MDALDAKQLQALDATAATLGLTTELLMERAGLELAQVIVDRYDKSTSVLFLCGSGNNGGDGLVGCRNLINKGYQASVLLSKKGNQPNLRILRKLGVPVHVWKKGFSFTPYDLVVDCLLGFSQKDAPSGKIAEIVSAIGQKKVIACDIPTGLNASTGEVYEPHVNAGVTVSFAAPKKGFDKKICGEIIQVGVGIPEQVYRQVGLESFLVDGSQLL